MGYCNYIATMDKEVVAELREKTLEQFLMDYAQGREYLPVYRLPTLEVVFEMGKYVEKEFLDPMKGENPTQLFESVDMSNEYEDEAIYVVGKEGLIALINAYRKRVISCYKNLLTPSESVESEHDKEETLEMKMKIFAEKRIFYWDNEYVDYLDMDEARPHNLSRFWDYEYMIFNLIHLLKTVDWEAKDLVLYGW